MGAATFFCGEWVYTGDESMWTINIDKHSIDISYDKHQFNGAFTGIKVNDGLTIYCEDNQWATHWIREMMSVYSLYAVS